MMLDDALFGCARNADAIIPSLDQFEFYSGGGIDITFLGMGEMDQYGNVNVSHLNGNLIGPGGFLEIAQNARKVVFCGTFDAKGSKIDVTPDGLHIAQSGQILNWLPWWKKSPLAPHTHSKAVRKCCISPNVRYSS